MLFNLIKQNDNFIPGDYVTIVTPTPWQYIYSDSVSPTWERFPGATLYRIQLEIYNGALVEEKTTSFENLTTTFNSITDGKYTIKVRSEKGSRYTEWRAVYFEIENLSAPTISAPSASEEVIAYGGLPYLVAINCSTLNWADHYHRQVATDSGFTNIISDEEFEPGYALDTNLNQYTTYYLRIRGRIGAVYGPWSDTRTFSLISE